MAYEDLTNAERAERRWIAEQRIRGRIWELQDHLCYLCHDPVQFEVMTLDHVWPKSRGGKRPQNILGAHTGCNNAKGDRVPTREEMAYLRRINERLG